MQELLRTIVAGLVEDPSAIAITEDAPNEEGVIVYHLHVAADDMSCHRQAGQNCPCDSDHHAFWCCKEQSENCS